MEFAQGFTPTQEQIDAVTAFTKNQKGLIKTILYPNLDVTQKEEIPSGLALVFDANSAVDPTIISDRLFETLAVTPIMDSKEYLKEHFELRSQQILDAAPQKVTHQPIAMDVRNDKEGRTTDRRSWFPDLGGRYGFVGVFSRVNADPRNPPDFYIAGRASVPALIQEIKSSTGKTWKELLSDPRLHFAERIAERNVRRNIANVADAAEVAIPVVSDVSSKVPNPSYAKPELAVPEWQQQTHGIRMTGPDQVTLTYGVTPAQQCMNLKNEKFFVTGSPYEGLAVYQMSKNDLLAAEMAVPCDTGRTGSMSNQPIASKGIHFEGDHDRHPDLDPVAYNPIGARMRKHMRRAGHRKGREEERMVPVCVKIYNPLK